MAFTPSKFNNKMICPNSAKIIILQNNHIYINSMKTT